MNHLVTDVARVVAAERLREADRTRAGRRLSRNARSIPMRAITQRSAPLLLAAAVFLLAFSSTATAAKLVTGKQVKNGSITSVDLRDGSMSGLDVADDSLTEDHFAELVVGPPGPQGPPGPRGDDGPRGVAGQSRLVYVTTGYTVPKASQRTWSADCPTGTNAVGGGLSSGSPFWFRMVASAPDISQTSWIVTAENKFGDGLSAYAWAVCSATS